MKINVNKDKQAQCPGCGTWNELELESIDGIYHEFTCCGRNFVVPLDEENLDNISKCKELNEIPKDWFIKKSKEVKEEE